MPGRDRQCDGDVSPVTTRVSQDPPEEVRLGGVGALPDLAGFQPLGIIDAGVKP